MRLWKGASSARTRRSSRVALENQVRGLAVAFGVRPPRGLSPAFVGQVVAMGDGVAGLSAAMGGLAAAREAVLRAVLGAVAAIDADPAARARVALARRLAVIVDAMLRHGTAFRPA